MDPRPDPTPLDLPTRRATGHDLFLLAGWLLVATPTLALWAQAPRLDGGPALLARVLPFLALALAWAVCGLPPFPAWIQRRTPMPVRPALPGHTLRRMAFLALSALLLQPYQAEAAGWETPFPGLAVLALALLMQDVGTSLPTWLRRRGTASGAVAVALAALSWLLDLLWLVATRRLPGEVLRPSMALPGLLILAAGAALLVWASLRPRPPLPGTATSPESRLPTWLAAAALLLALAARRPGVALGAGVLAGWFALPRHPANPRP